MNTVSTSTSAAAVLVSETTSGVEGALADHTGKSGGGTQRRPNDSSSPPPEPPAGGSPTQVPQGVNTATGISELATVLNVDPATLTSAVGNGTSIAQLLASTSKSALAGYFSSQGVQYDARL